MLEDGRGWGRAWQEWENWMANPGGGQRPNNNDIKQNGYNKQKGEATQDDFPELKTEQGEAHTGDENKPTRRILM